jgi:isopenicillin N synthase-like dioxygenase
VFEIPVIDIDPLRQGGAAAAVVAASLDAACRDVGFVYIVGHGVDPDLTERLEALAREFFALPETEKGDIAMARAGSAWRGWFPLGGELTAGVPDQKEGVYFGAELPATNALVVAGTPMHGPNLFPVRPAGLRAAVLDYMDALTAVGQLVLSGMALGLGLDPDWFSTHLTSDPLILFRIFRYPPMPPGHGHGQGRGQGQGWSVGEHTDYGLLTILGQDDRGGLQVHTQGRWVDAPPRQGAFVCNLGDMMDRLTGGRYRSTPHRVRNAGRTDRLSFPFFLDPAWQATVERLPIVARPVDDDAARRWDQRSVHGFEGTYGQYILSKVGRVFPDLAGGSA